MKKVGVLIVLFILILSIVVVLAQDNTTANDDSNDDTFATAGDELDLAYSCLKNEVKDKCSSLSVEEQVFSLLALSYDSGIQKECKDDLRDNEDANHCWPKGSCRLRDTSLAILALDNINSDIEESKEWLLDHKKVADDLTWFLEIDTGEESTCKISYTGRDYTLTIKSDKKISSSAGDCLALSMNSYWLKIDSDCIETNFTISCNKDFISTLLYKKSISDTYYVSSQTETATAEGETEHRVESYCFEQSGDCNYEGSLWATFALSKTGEDISGLLPYLISFAEGNGKYNPHAFLYILTGYNEYMTSLGGLQNSEGFWNLDSPYGKFYDTSLSVLSIPNSVYSTTAKTSLLDTQGTDGCWQNSVRDTAFILYAGWGKEPVVVTGVDIDYCTDFDYYCITEGECTDVEGNKLSNYYCSGVSKICCDEPASEESCSEQSGEVCTSDEECKGSYVTSLDTSYCCLAGCQAKQENACEDAGNNCRVSCQDNEDVLSYTCEDANDFCCGLKSSPEPSYWWIWLLVILIILVIIAIIFRDKFKIFLYSLKTKFKKGGGKGSEQRRPPFPPGPRPMGGPFQRPMPPRKMPLRAPMQRPVSKKIEDKELDETLKKLKEISK
ncbi:MAG: hypothetical protein ABIH72_03690 [archaeon]